MSNTAKKTSPDTLCDTSLFWLITVAMGITVFLYSGKILYALMILEIISASLLLLVLFNNKAIHSSKLTSIFLITIVITPFVYLIPIPDSIWKTLPGHEPYVDALTWLTNHKQTPWLSFSIVPQRTLHSAITIISLVAIFIATSSLSIEKQTRLIYIFLGIACIQAMIGLIQYSNPSMSLLFFEYTVAGNAQGTYLNRDHFSALMHMSLPIAIGLVACNIGVKHKTANSHISSALLNKVFSFTLAMLLILLGGIFARSRAGVFLIMLGIIISVIVFSKHIGGKRSTGLAVTIGTLGIGSAVSIGLIPVLNRFIVANPMEDLRWTLFADAIHGIKTFFPFGSGPGTFQDIYRTLQPVERLKFINHVHNDYLELMFETGIIGIFILLLILVLYIHGWVSLKNYNWGTYRFIKTAAGISLFLISLHSLVDFNLHTPANAVFVFFLAAIFLSKQKA